ncbi:patatin-like phospholipase family protein [Paenibacillus thermotolerans]|uniref:patatin-like phospholipase family protein n=1 Tax=Paenibacillus thermotolerans TaxID=3027807 RepID=UPI002368D860|nr:MULTISPECIES: patatin-like phospholipase family protein [unclassified Paenibacillus]
MRVNAVFQGGGVKGIGLVGAIYAAERYGVTFHQTAGTSVGAVVASLVAAGYSADEMKSLILEMPLEQFTRKDWIHHLTFVGPAVRLLVKKGLYSGDPIERWVEQQLARKGIRTFGDLPPNALRVVASDISLGKLLELPGDIQQYGMDPMNLSVARAVRMSASIPFFFDPVVFKLRQKQQRRQLRLPKSVYVVDGAILSNYPLWIFDKELKERPGGIPTLGFQLVGRTSAAPNNINGPISMLHALFSTMVSAHDERYIEKHSRFRTIKILSDMVGSTEFSVSKEKQMELFESGLKAGNEYFQSWTYSGYSAEMDKWMQTIFPELKKNAGAPSGPAAKRQ